MYSYIIYYIKIIINIHIYNYEIQDFREILTTQGTFQRKEYTQ